MDEAKAVRAGEMVEMAPPKEKKKKPKKIRGSASCRPWRAAPRGRRWAEADERGPS